MAGCAAPRQRARRPGTPGAALPERGCNRRGAGRGRVYHRLAGKSAGVLAGVKRDGARLGSRPWAVAGDRGSPPPSHEDAVMRERVQQPVDAAGRGAGNRVAPARRVVRVAAVQSGSGGAGTGRSADGRSTGTAVRPMGWNHGLRGDREGKCHAIPAWIPASVAALRGHLPPPVAGGRARGAGAANAKSRSPPGEAPSERRGRTTHGVEGTGSPCRADLRATGRRRLRPAL